MKKNILISIFKLFLVALIIVLLCTSKANVKIINNESYYSDFYVENGKVFI